MNRKDIQGVAEKCELAMLTALARIAKLEVEVRDRDARIAALTNGLREACDAIEASEGLSDAALYRLLALADD